MSILLKVAGLGRFVSRDLRKITLNCCRALSTAKFKETGPMDTKNVKTMQEVKMKLTEIMGIQKGYVPQQKPRDHLEQYLPESQEELPVREMDDSFDIAIIPISKNIELQNKYLSYLGHIRMGRLMEDMDLFAVWCVMKHIKNNKLPENTPTPHVILTILVDEIIFMDYVTKPMSDIRISGHVCWVGKSSAEVVVWIEQENEGKWETITKALFMLAARNTSNTKPAFVNPLKAKNNEEEKILRGGEERKRVRQQNQRRSLFKTVPDEVEQKLIHQLFLNTVDEDDGVLNKRVLPPNCKWMSDSQFHNMIFCHPEERNFHNTIYGGFIMRHALELSWNAGYIYSKQRPILLSISDIAFHRPVEVGSMLKMSAYVSYTYKEYMQIIVYVEVLNYRTGEHSTSNFFHYTYKAAKPVEQIMPKSYHEAMMYLDGRRHFRHVMGLTQPTAEVKN